MAPAVLQSFSLTLYKTDTFLKGTPRDGPCRSTVIFFDSIKQTPFESGHLEMAPAVQCYHLEFSYLLDVINLAFRGRRFRRCAMQNSRKNSKIDIRLSLSFLNEEQNLQKNFHRSLKYFSKVSCLRPTAVPGSRVGGGGVLGDGGEVVLNSSTNRYAGRLGPEVQALTFFIDQFYKKKVPLFVYFLLTNSTFTCLV